LSGLSGLRLARLGLMLLAVALLALNGAPAAFAAGGHINQITVAGSINAGSADYIVESIQLSEADGARALLIELDTPGGFVNASLDIVKSMLNAKVPIIVWVTPRGAWAASAGTFITVAANIAAMSPGSSIGAAHPVGLTGGGQKGEDGEPAQEDVSLQKMENILAATMEGVAQQRERNVEWVVDAVRNSITATAEEALELGVIDLVVDDRDELLAAIDGREVKVDGDPVTLDVADASVRVLDMTIRQKVFNFLASPDVLIILLVAGALGLYLEFNNPGMIVPGLIGLVCMVLVGFGLQILPFSWIGLTLILAGLALMVAEIFFASFGVLFALGIACFFIGGTMVFDTPELSNLTVSVWSVLLPAVIGLGAFGGLVVFTVGRSLLLEQSAGVDEMRGLIGEATTSLSASNEGKVFVRGEYWNAIGEDGLEPGERIEVVGVEGMKLRVRRAGGTR
jgi:membrane-bound serine protease (ClpP class)